MTLLEAMAGFEVWDAAGGLAVFVVRIWVVEIRATVSFASKKLPVTEKSRSIKGRVFGEGALIICWINSVVIESAVKPALSNIERASVILVVSDSW